MDARGCDQFRNFCICAAILACDHFALCTHLCAVHLMSTSAAAAAKGYVSGTHRYTRGARCAREGHRQRVLARCGRPCTHLVSAQHALWRECQHCPSESAVSTRSDAAQRVRQSSPVRHASKSSKRSQLSLMARSQISGHHSCVKLLVIIDHNRSKPRPPSAAALQSPVVNTQFVSAFCASEWGEPDISLCTKASVCLVVCSFGASVVTH